MSRTFSLAVANQSEAMIVMQRCVVATVFAAIRNKNAQNVACGRVNARSNLPVRNAIAFMTIRRPAAQNLVRRWPGRNDLLGMSFEIEWNFPKGRA